MNTQLAEKLARIEELTKLVNEGKDTDGKMFEEIQWCIAQTSKYLEPIEPLSDSSTQVYFSSLVNDQEHIIEERCKKWFKDVHESNNSVMIKDCTTEGLQMDLDFMFSRSLMVFRMVDDMGYMSDSDRSHFASHYLRYQTQGYKAVVGYYVHEYNWREDRVYTQQELADTADKMNKLTMEILDELKLEDKK